MARRKLRRGCAACILLQELFKIAVENQIKDIAFPSISTGIYGYPLPEAAEIAVRTLHEYPAIEVQMVCFDERTKRAYEQAERAYRKKYDCTDIKETVYIEYENLPMKKVFKNEALKRKILQTAKRQGEGSGPYPTDHSGRHDFSAVCIFKRQGRIRDGNL